VKLRLEVDIDIPQLEGWSKEIAQAFGNMFKAIIEGVASVSPWGATQYNITVGPERPPSGGTESSLQERTILSPRPAVVGTPPPEPRKGVGARRAGPRKGDRR
jgi:hypothetical protein